MAGHAQHDERFLPKNLSGSFDAVASSDGLVSSTSRSSLCESIFPETQKDTYVPPTTAPAPGPTVHGSGNHEPQEPCPAISMLAKSFMSVCMCNTPGGTGAGHG